MRFVFIDMLLGLMITSYTSAVRLFINYRWFYIELTCQSGFHYLDI